MQDPNYDEESGMYRSFPSKEIPIVVKHKVEENQDPTIHTGNFLKPDLYESSKINVEIPV